MRTTYRSHNVKDYWTERWADIPADSAMSNGAVYPLKYALKTVTANDGPILEAGCGAGRILRHYHEQGYDITGVDFIEVAIQKLLQADPTLKVQTGDIAQLRFADATFRYILAFGLYHNLEHDLDKAIDESWRVLSRGGRLCASFRADNLQTRLTDWLADRKSSCWSRKAKGSIFHKRNLTRGEFTNLFERAGFVVESVEPVENMPILYKFAFFRARDHKKFDENKARTEGYRLSTFGQWLQHLLMQHFADQFCNIYVMIAMKP